MKGKPTRRSSTSTATASAIRSNRENGELLVAEKYDPIVNWATHIDMTTGADRVVEEVLDPSAAARTTTPRTSALRRSAQRTSSRPRSRRRPKVFYVPTNHVCMDYEPFKDQLHCRPALRRCDAVDVSAAGRQQPRQFHRLGRRPGKILWSIPEPSRYGAGALATAGDVVFYGTLEGYLKAVDLQTGKELYRFKTPSGIIGNVMTYVHDGKQYIAVLSGVGGWAGIGMAAGSPRIRRASARSEPTRRSHYTQLGGVLTVFALPHERPAYPDCLAQ